MHSSPANKTSLSRTYLFPPLNKESGKYLNSLHTIIDRAYPLPGRFRSALPSNIAELSRLLTSARGERSKSYLGHPNLLAAYLRYFLPWNLYRLCRLLPSLDIRLSAGDTIIDLGCGPLTFVSALWISRPDLRNIPLEFRCVDQNGPALEAGKKIFFALCGNDSGYPQDNYPWKIHTVKEKIERFAPKGKPASLVCAVNVFNEMFGEPPAGDINKQKQKAIKAAALIIGSVQGERTQGERDRSVAQGSCSASVLVIEPGVPAGGQFISLLRAEFIKRNFFPTSPCTHEKDCPMMASNPRAAMKSRWCHFSFDTPDAPQNLHSLSKAAGIPKERAVLSFLFTGTGENSKQNKNEKIPVRIISDSFPLGDGFGRYGCSELGLVLLTGNKTIIEKLASGFVIKTLITKNGQRDAKSGALLAPVLFN